MPEVPDVVGTMWRAIAVPRFVTLAHAVVINAMQWSDSAHPVGGWLVVTGIAVWTLLTTWAYDRPERRRWPLLCADVAVAVGALVAGRFLEGQVLLEQGATIANFWVIAPILAWGVHAGWGAGVIAAIVVAGTDLATRLEIDSENIANVFLMLLVGGGVGYWATLVRNAAAERARYAELAARTAERERLARVVHDGVLQVLAYVQRRGAQIGGETAELAVAAGEQEEILRALVQGTPVDTNGTDDQVDIRQLFGELAGSGVSVATPADPVTVTVAFGREVLAAVRAALDNVVRHAAGSTAYLLLEDEGGFITVSVRDDGPGIADGRLDEASAAGRMGVRRSIIGRIEDLGGSATLSSAPGHGTEWELRIPRTREID